MTTFIEKQEKKIKASFACIQRKEELRGRGAQKKFGIRQPSIYIYMYFYHAWNYYRYFYIYNGVQISNNQHQESNN